MIKVFGPVHNINLKTKGSFNDFVLGTAPEGSNALNFLEDGKIYIFMESNSNFFHFFYNLMIPALKFLSHFENNNLHFVFDNRFLKVPKDNYDNLIIDLLEEKKINYTMINGDSNEFVNAKNFVPVNCTFLPEGVDFLYDYLIDKYQVSQVSPNKKIYISRKKQNVQEKRVDNEGDLELFFQGLGFEVVYPEEISTFKEQFELFNSCSVLAGLTGSGLANLLFMQKGQTVMELVTKLEIRGGDEEIQNEIHNFYKELSTYKEHVLMNVFNMEKSNVEIKKKITRVLQSLRSISE
jgi:capsular polysaccharide biosynthesis protein